MSSTMADEVRCFSPTFLPGGITASLMTMIPSPHWPPSARDYSFFHRICLPSFCSILSPSTKIPRRKPLFFPPWEFLDFPREVSISWIPCPWPATAGGSNFPSMPDGGLQVSPPGFFRVPSLNRSSIRCLQKPFRQRLFGFSRRHLRNFRSRQTYFPASSLFASQQAGSFMRAFLPRYLHGFPKILLRLPQTGLRIF